MSQHSISLDGSDSLSVKEIGVHINRMHLEPMVILYSWQ